MNVPGSFAQWGGQLAKRAAGVGKVRAGDLPDRVTSRGQCSISSNGAERNEQHLHHQQHWQQQQR